jgi:hypothetical protein
MRRKRVLKRGRVVSIIVAGAVGYLIGAWHTVALRGPAVSAAQAVALRFPQDLDDAPAATAVEKTSASAADAQLALLSPQPMASQAGSSQAGPAQSVAVQVPAATSIAGEIDAVPVRDQAALQRPVQRMASLPAHEMTARETRAMQSAAEAQAAEAKAAEAKTAEAKAVEAKLAEAKAAAARRHAERPGFMLNDAQIASIKDRLHMTPDQEQMWPAVEAALRNLAYVRAREARNHSASSYQLASADPNSTQVQDLKSAAIPLLMSFNSEQKDEVRNIVHVMGLDQLANQF